MHLYGLWYDVECLHPYNGNVISKDYTINGCEHSASKPLYNALPSFVLAFKYAVDFTTAICPKMGSIA